MATFELDPDVTRWGLHLLDVGTLSTESSRRSIIQYDADFSRVEHLREGYAEPSHVENDEIIAQAYQEELSRLASVETSGCHSIGEGHLQASILAQDWLGPSKRHNSPGHENDWKTANDHGGVQGSRDHQINREFATDDFRRCGEETTNYSGRRINEGLVDEMGTVFTYSSPGENSVYGEGWLHSLDITNESDLDGEVGRRLNQMVPVPHVPRTNEKIPTMDEQISDHQRLLERLELYELVERKVQGDGNCQFRALSDQLYRSPDHHGFVREQIIQQLKNHPEIYEGYVPMSYADYLKKMSKSGEWGDHVTLQAAADWYGVKLFVITSFKDTCSIELLPQNEKSKRVMFLSFWAEVHYNSIYPEGEFPTPCLKKKKRWWNFGSWDWLVIHDFQI